MQAEQNMKTENKQNEVTVFFLRLHLLKEKKYMSYESMMKYLNDWVIL